MRSHSHLKVQKLLRISFMGGFMKCFADLTFSQNIRFPLLFFFIFNCVESVLAYRRITIVDILFADLVTHFQFVIEEPLPLGLDLGVWSFQAQVFVAAHHGVEERWVTSSTALLVAILDRLRKSGEIRLLRNNGE